MIESDARTHGSVGRHRTLERCSKCGNRRTIEFETDGNGRMVVIPQPCRHCERAEAEAMAKSREWDAAECLRRGAEVFRDHPDATAAQAFDLLSQWAKRRGATLGVSRNSWIKNHASKARRIVGVAAPKGGRPPRDAAPSNGRGQGSGREGPARPEGDTSSPGTTPPGRTETPEPVAAPTTLREVEKPARDLHTPVDDSGLRAAATALLAAYEKIALDGLGGSWIEWLGEGMDEVTMCLRLRKALGLPLPEELVELREALSS
jgi:hypothetical protein